MTGRPTDYREEYDLQAEKLCRLGATDKEIADFFEVTEQTINNWKINFPSFFESLKKGKVIADMNVADSLYHRALGYSHADTDIRVVDKDLVMTPIIKQYPPDTTAGIFWLKNRRPKEWRDKQEIEAKVEGSMVFTGIEMVEDDEEPEVPTQA